MPGDRNIDVTIWCKPASNDMDDATRTFDRLRPRLKGIARRILGSGAEADRVLEDAARLWDEAAPAERDRAEAWLIATVARLSLDRLEASTAGTGGLPHSELPERVMKESPPDTPAEMRERADDISVSFLTLIAQLPPETGTAFVLRDVFDLDYPVIAQMVGKSEAECVQIVQIARAWMRSRRPR